MGGRKGYSSLGSLASAAAATAVEMPFPTHRGTVLVYGTFVGTWRINGSLDGTNYAPLTGYTGSAPAALSLAGDFPYLQLECTAWTSGTINAQFQPPDWEVAISGVR